ncbi:XrtA system polysaccharide chain length determinant [Candidatus Omnitrophota bacterium]
MVVSISTITGVARNYVEIFFRRKWLMIVPVLLATGIAVAYSFTIPPKYRSSAIILVEEEKVSNPLISGLAISSSVQGRLATIVKVLLSRPVLDKVIAELNLSHPGLLSTEYEALVVTIRNSIAVHLLSMDILKVSCEHKDPVACQKIVNSVTNLFIKYNLELQMKETDAGIQFLNHQKEIYEKKLEESEKALRDFKEEFQETLSMKTSKKVSKLIGAPAALTNITILRYTQYKEDLIDLSLRLQEVVEEKKQLEKLLEQEQEFIVSERLVDPTAARLKDELAERQVELAELEADATGAHPMVIRLKRQITELKDTIKNRRSKVYSSSDKESLNPLYQDMKIKLNQLTSEEKALRIRINLTELYVGDYAIRIKEIPKREAEMENLQRDYQINSEMYTELANRLETAFLTRRLEMQDKGTRFKIVDPARVPLKPFKPNRKFMALGGLMFGIIIGIGLIFVAEMTDHSFTEINQLRNFLNIPVLGSVSQILTIEESEEIKIRKKLGVLFLVVFVLFMVLGGIAKFVLSNLG